MKFKTRATSQIEHLGVLRYKDGNSAAIKIPQRWVEGTKEERMGKILQDLPEAAFRSPDHLSQTLRSIYAEIYRQYPDLREPLEEGGESAGHRVEGKPTGQSDPQ